MQAQAEVSTALEEGLPLDELESRLLAAAKRHHLEERNIAYWLLEIEERGLHRERGFSSIGDYAMELVGIKPRKAQYLVFIASRLESLPRIRAAFDTGDLSWTKAREITGVANTETEGEWLEKAHRLSNRELEREVRQHAGQTKGEFATVAISMPVEILEMWNDAYELAERLCGTELEKWQVLEPALAEFLGTHVPAAADAMDVANDDESALPAAVSTAVFERDGWQCAFPGCSMRKTLDAHHIVFRSRGGSDELDNLVSLCRIHHDLIHRGICLVTGRAGDDLKFERPRLVNERATDVARHRGDVEDVDDVPDDDESWRDEVVADIFDGPPAPAYEPPFADYNDFLDDWIANKRASEASDRARRRRAGAHVCAETEALERGTCNTREPRDRPLSGQSAINSS